MSEEMYWLNIPVYVYIAFLTGMSVNIYSASFNIKTFIGHL